MTTNNLPSVPQYTVAGTGPYAVGHEYTEGALVVTVVLAGVTTQLAEPEYSVSPVSGASGSITLDAATATTYAGAQLFIDRVTDVEQGWASGGAPREDALEAQLDRTVQGQQDLKRQNTRVLQLPIDATGISPVIPAPVAGAMLIGNAGATGWENGGDAGDIAAAQANAAAAAASLAAFNLVFLGSFSAAPTTGPGSAPLAAGMLYINTTTGFIYGYNGTAWAIAGGYIHPDHTGDVTSSGDGATTIGANKVTLAKLAQLTAPVILGRVTAGLGDVEVLTPTQLTGMLDPATTSAAGVMKQATQAQAIAATDPSVFANVVDTKAAIAALAPGGMVKIEHVAASNLLTLDMTGFDPTKYGGYEWDLSNLLPSVDQSALLAQFSTDGGVTWDNTPGNYVWWSYGRIMTGGAVFSASGTAGDSQISLSLAAASTSSIGTAASEFGLSGTLKMHGPDLTGSTKVLFDYNYERAAGGEFAGDGSGTYRPTAAVNAIRFFMSSGNIVSGEVTMFGKLKV